EPGKNVTLVELPWAQMHGALKSRSIDAGLAYEPFASRLANQPDLRLLSWLEDTIPAEGYIVGLFAMNRDRVRANPALRRQFVRAYVRGVAFQKQNPEEAYAIGSKYIKLPVEELKRSRPHEFQPDGKVRMDVLRKTAERLKALGLIESVPNLDQAVW